ncbi:hypothetical protein PHYPSEUDO_003886 [Phytophthora pseudosyringae]|uniref:ATPase AAA-type core domain-containing protein n=1 Tax=Phytophthora pseudosyringae TaxID=221518 RepID=A0A8T1VTC7_9STRA|nr:hypothetical protein PHYPSEUDO_003886 [Phytophthora pseudosyringae]
MVILMALLFPPVCQTRLNELPLSPEVMFYDDSRGGRESMYFSGLVNECLELLLDLHSVADQLTRGSVWFLDEPKSGLDARSAKLVMVLVRKVASTGLLLLKRAGETVFVGDLGQKF